MKCKSDQSYVSWSSCSVYRQQISFVVDCSIFPNVLHGVRSARNLRVYKTQYFDCSFLFVNANGSFGY